MQKAEEKYCCAINGTNRPDDGIYHTICFRIQNMKMFIVQREQPHDAGMVQTIQQQMRNFPAKQANDTNLGHLQCFWQAGVDTYQKHEICQDVENRCMQNAAMCKNTAYHCANCACFLCGNAVLLVDIRY